MAKLWHFHRGDKFVPHIASRKRQLIHFKICHLLGKRCSSYSGSVLSDLRNRWPMTWNICEYELTYKISLRPINRRFKWFEETNVNCLTPAQACQHLSGKSKFPSFPLYSIATEDNSKLICLKALRNNDARWSMFIVQTTKAAEIRNLHCGITHPLRTGGTWQCLTFKMGSMDT